MAIDSRRYITDLSSKISPTGDTTLELDSHADTCVLGRDALIFLDYDRPVIVEGYDPLLPDAHITRQNVNLANLSQSPFEQHRHSVKQ